MSNMNKSPKVLHVEDRISERVSRIVADMTDGDDLPLKLWKVLKEDAEVKSIQDYANTVSITRLGLNDHGPVHMKTVCRNALKMLCIFHEAGFATSASTKLSTSLEKEKSGMAYRPYFMP